MCQRKTIHKYIQITIVLLRLYCINKSVVTGYKSHRHGCTFQSMTSVSSRVRWPAAVQQTSLIGSPTPAAVLCSHSRSGVSAERMQPLLCSSSEPPWRLNKPAVGERRWEEACAGERGTMVCWWCGRAVDRLLNLCPGCWDFCCSTNHLNAEEMLSLKKGRFLRMNSVRQPLKMSWIIWSCYILEQLNINLDFVLTAGSPSQPDTPLESFSINLLQPKFAKTTGLSNIYTYKKNAVLNVNFEDPLSNGLFQSLMWSLVLHEPLQSTLHNR